MELRLPQFAIPVINTIMNFHNGHLLYGIVTKEIIGNIFNIAIDPLSELIFFGYKEQCEKQWFNFPGRIVKLKRPNE